MSVAFSPDDEKLGATTADGKLLVYELDGSSECRRGWGSGRARS